MITEPLLPVPYDCKEPNCERVFDSPQALQGHMIAHRPPVTCPECGKAYKSPGALGNHRKQHHGIVNANGYAARQQRTKREAVEVDAGDILDAVIAMVAPGQAVPVIHVRSLVEWYAATERLIAALRS